MKLNNCSVSVIMSVYMEPELWLRKAIDSILNQTFRDFEFIIVNDKPDNSINKKVVTEYAEKDERIVIINNKENIGLTKSLNIALKLAKGKYIARMDADDISSEHRLQKQYDYLEHNSDCLLVGSYMTLINEQGKKIGDINYPIKSDEIENDLVLKNVVSHPTFFFRRIVFDEYDIFYNEHFKYAQDYNFVTRVIKKGRVSNISERLLNYRKSDNQIGKSKIKEQDAYANEIRKEYIQYLLYNSYDFKLKEDDNIYETLKGLKIKHSKDKKLKKMILTSVIYLKQASFLERLLLVLSFNYSLIDSLKILKSFCYEFYFSRLD